MQGKQAEQFKAVAGRSLQEEVFQFAIVGINAFHAAEFFDQKAQRHFHHDAVESGAADAHRQDDDAHLTQQAAGECAQRPDQAFGQRKNESITQRRTQMSGYRFHANWSCALIYRRPPANASRA